MTSLFLQHEEEYILEIAFHTIHFFSKLDFSEFSEKNIGAVEMISSSILLQSSPPSYHSATHVIERMLNWH